MYYEDVDGEEVQSLDLYGVTTQAVTWMREKPGRFLEVAAGYGNPPEDDDGVGGQEPHMREVGLLPDEFDFWINKLVTSIGADGNKDGGGRDERGFYEYFFMCPPEDGRHCILVARQDAAGAVSWREEKLVAEHLVVPDADVEDDTQHRFPCSFILRQWESFDILDHRDIAAPRARNCKFMGVTATSECTFQTKCWLYKMGGQWSWHLWRGKTIPIPECRTIVDTSSLHDAFWHETYKEFREQKPHAQDTFATACINGLRRLCDEEDTDVAKPQRLFMRLCVLREEELSRQLTEPHYADPRQTAMSLWFKVGQLCAIHPNASEFPPDTYVVAL